MLDANVVVAGRYRIVRLLGRGGMGAVYEAVQLALSRRVALKTLLPDLADDPDLLARFRREAETTAALRHPNIVAVTDFFAEQGYPPFIVMELLEGATLSETMTKEGRIDPARAAFIGTQMLAALGAAHRVGVVHRDVKPGNVFIETTTAMRDLVKVLDFGVAKLLADAGRTALRAATHDGQVLGTLAYMPPEQSGGGGVDARSDLYAVGATLYHAISGLRPHEAAVRMGGPRPSLGVVAPWAPPGIVFAIDRSMRADPIARFASAEEMAAALSPPPAVPHPERISRDPGAPRSAPTLGGSTDTSSWLPRPQMAGGGITTVGPVDTLPRPSVPVAFGPAGPRGTPSHPPPAATVSSPKRGWTSERTIIGVAIVLALVTGIASTYSMLRATVSSMFGDSESDIIARNFAESTMVPPCPAPQRCDRRHEDQGLVWGLCSGTDLDAHTPGELVLASREGRDRPAMRLDGSRPGSVRVRWVGTSVVDEEIPASRVLGRICPKSP